MQNDARILGFVSARLLDDWLDTHSISYQEMPHVYYGVENWFIKSKNFLKRKFLKSSYFPFLSGRCL